jgi:hypothetical protein
MSRRYLAFDLETAKLLPRTVNDVLAHRPLGIACAAAVASGLDEPITWHGRDGDRPSAQMSRDEAGAMVDDLVALVEDGYTLVTWNGLSFDFNVLAEESGGLDACAGLAHDHVDMMFHAVCRLGHYVALAKAAEGFGLAGKSGGLSGHEAPALWAEGRYDEVLQYNIQDARLCLDIAREAERRGELNWITGRGRIGRMPLERGWLSVKQARRLPLPDTSWMSDPPARDDALAWFPSGTLTD